VGVVRRPLDPEGYVLVHGELWRARSTDGPIPAGEPVEVTGLGAELVLDVRPARQPAPVDA
jgi:membrane-bound serine protease (ClpP class)